MMSSSDLHLFSCCADIRLRTTAVRYCFLAIFFAIAADVRCFFFSLCRSRKWKPTLPPVGLLHDPSPPSPLSVAT